VTRTSRFLAGGWSLALLALVAGGGCGSDGLGQRYPVSGRVTYKGAPVPSGTIAFIPEESSGKPAVGTISDGSYSLTTLSPGDGAFPGKYQVSVVSREGDQAAGAGPNSLGRLKKIAVANLTAKSRLPAKYETAAKSGLAREVLAQPNHFDFDLVE
jgi:hypothetical protein